MSSLYGNAAAPDGRQRLIKALAVSLVFHALLLLTFSAVSLRYQPKNRIGPMQVTLETDVPPGEPVPVPVTPPPEPEEPQEAESGSLEEPAPVLPAPVPDKSPAAVKPPAPGTAAPAARTDEPPRLSSAYQGLFAAPEKTSPPPGRSGPVLTAPERTVTAPVQKREAGVIGSGALAADTPPANESDAPVEASSLDLRALDRALAAMEDQDTRVVMVAETGAGVSTSVPGDPEENQSQIIFEDGVSRKLEHSEPFDIPPGVRSFGQPDFLIKVSFRVTSEGFLRDLKITPPSGIPELEAAIINSMRNWRFSRSQTQGIVGAQVQLLIKVK